MNLTTIVDNVKLLLHKPDLKGFSMKQQPHFRNLMTALILAIALFFFTPLAFAQSAKIITLKDC